MEQKTIPYKIYLNESEMPEYWYNLRADMPKKPAPLLDPATHEPMTAEALRAVFCEEHGNIPPVWHLGECLDNARASGFFNGISGALGTPIKELPYAFMSPEWSNEKGRNYKALADLGYRR